MAGCRDDVNKHLEEGETAVQEYVRSPPSAPTTTAYEPLLPCQLTTPNVPLSSLQKDNLQLSCGEDQKEIPHSGEAGLEFQHVFVKELKKREKKKPIDVLCSRELTGYVCVTVGVIMLLYLLSLI